MTTETDTAEAAIRALVERRMQAVRDRDAEAAVADVADDVVTFDVVDPLLHRGRKAVRRRAETWFSSFTGAVGFEMRDLAITVSGETAFSHSLNRYSGATVNGPLGMWVRVTTGYRRIDGRWMITHEHGSVPFNPETGRPSLELEP